jgi:deoxyadenosine/deoxycytidine kinase
MGKIIVLTGNTGVGKTTLARVLSKSAGFNLALEQHSERPFQALFKFDPRYALPNQVDYLLLRAEQERILRQSPQVGLVDGGLDQDFHGFTRLFHARGLLTDAEFDLCRRFYTFCRAELPPPDLVIHLTANVDVLRTRLARRERINVATPEDLTLLASFLDDWLVSLPPERVLRLDVSSASLSYAEIVPGLLSQIRARLGLDAGTYDTGYIP